MGKYRKIKLEGTPFERGLKYGTTCKTMIEKSISNYADMFQAFSRLEWNKAQSLAMNFLPWIQNNYPDLIKEMEGISEGANLSFKDILTLNSRSEIVLDTDIDGCTAFGVTPRYSLNDRTYVCQNWDWIKRQEETLVIVELHQDPLPAILMVAEAGIISGKGLNSSGLGTCFNALSTGKGQSGVPVHILLRKMLDSETLGDAVQSIATARRASSGNFLIGTEDGEIINIESTPSDFGVLYAEEGYIAHTNHFLSMNLVCRENDFGKVILPDTFHRLGRINVLLSSTSGNINFDQCQTFLADHLNRPDSICRHEDAFDPEGKRLCSVYSIIMDLEEKTIWISDGTPCGGNFQPFRIDHQEDL